MIPEYAFNRLVDAGYLVPNEAGWYRAAKPPTKKDLAWYVAAIKTLGAWSVETKTTTGRVDLSKGDLPDEVLFRLRSRTR